MASNIHHHSSSFISFSLNQSFDIISPFGASNNRTGLGGFGTSSGMRSSVLAGKSEVMPNALYLGVDDSNSTPLVKYTGMQDSHLTGLLWLGGFLLVDASKEVSMCPDLILFQRQLLSWSVRHGAACLWCLYTLCVALRSTGEVAPGSMR